MSDTMTDAPLDVRQKAPIWPTREMVDRHARFAPEYLAGFAASAKPVDTRTLNRSNRKKGTVSRFSIEETPR